MLLYWARARVQHPARREMNIHIGVHRQQPAADEKHMKYDEFFPYKQI